VIPSSDPFDGGNAVLITNTIPNIGNGTDITNVTLCGMSVSNIESQSATQMIVVAGGAALSFIHIFSSQNGHKRKQRRVSTPACTYPQCYA
jgi:hypothetical protein